jgi:hypothetical protein
VRYSRSQLRLFTVTPVRLLAVEAKGGSTALYSSAGVLKRVAVETLRGQVRERLQLCYVNGSLALADNRVERMNGSAVTRTDRMRIYYGAVKAETSFPPVIRVDHNGLFNGTADVDGEVVQRVASIAKQSSEVFLTTVQPSSPKSSLVTDLLAPPVTKLLASPPPKPSEAGGGVSVTTPGDVTKSEEIESLISAVRAGDLKGSSDSLKALLTKEHFVRAYSPQADLLPGRRPYTEVVFGFPQPYSGRLGMFNTDAPNSAGRVASGTVTDLSMVKIVVRDSKVFGLEILQARKFVFDDPALQKLSDDYEATRGQHNGD